MPDTTPSETTAPRVTVNGAALERLRERQVQEAADDREQAKRRAARAMLSKRGFGRRGPR